MNFKEKHELVNSIYDYVWECDNLKIYIDKFQSSVFVNIMLQYKDKINLKKIKAYNHGTSIIIPKFNKVLKNLGLTESEILEMFYYNH